MNEADTTGQPDLKGHVIKYGLLIAVINIILGLLFYIIDATLLASMWTGIFMLLVNLGLVLYAGFAWRKENGGFLPFKSAFLATFLVLALSGLIGVGFRILLFNVIDPGLPELLVDASMDQARAIMETFGTPEDQMDEALETARADASERFSAGGMFMGYLWSLIFMAIGALIIGAIIKKNKPESEL